MNALLSNTTVSAASRTAGSTSLLDSPSGPSQTWSHTIQVHTHSHTHRYRYSQLLITDTQGLYVTGFVFDSDVIHQGWATY